MRSKYQLFPDLLPDRFAALKQSIAEEGQLEDIACDGDGNILDGHQRERAFGELGITEVRRAIINLPDEASKWRYVLNANSHRRMVLSQEEKRRIIEAYLKADAQYSNVSIARAIGVSDHTIASIRQQLEATSQIARFDTLVGADGKKRKKRLTRVITNTRREADKAISIMRHLPETGRAFDIITAKRRARREEKRFKRQLRLIAPPLESDSIKLFCCKFQDLAIDPKSINTFVTDPPWEMKWFPYWEQLGAFAERALVDGGTFVSYVGQMALEAAVIGLGKHLKYRWENSVMFKGNGFQPVHFGARENALRVLTGHKSVLLYSKGNWTKEGQWFDVIQGTGKEKDLHDWQQSLGEAEQLVKDFSNPGDLICDPCGGSFTVAVACLRLGRRCISCDCDPECVEKGRQRLALEIQRMKESA